jgi:prefoldin subunit 5
MQISNIQKLEILQLDRGNIDKLLSYIFNIQNRIDKLMNDETIESKTFQQWLIHLNSYTFKKEEIKDELKVIRLYVNKGISIRDLEDCELMKVMKSDVDSFNGEKVICEFDDNIWSNCEIESINPRYLLTDKKVYIIERVLRKNFWGVTKGVEMIEKGSFDVSEIDLNEKSHRELFYCFLRVYSDFENDLWIREFESFDLVVLNKLDDVLKIIPKEDLKQLVKINYEIENMISFFNHDVQNIRHFKFPDVSFRVPLKLNAFQPGEGWGLNTPMLSILQDLRIKSLLISYSLIVRNLYVYSILTDDEVNKQKYLLLLEQHGLLESYFEKMTRNSISKSSSKIINELKQINQTIEQINAQMALSGEINSKMNSIDNTLKFNSLVSAYTAYKLS